MRLKARLPSRVRDLSAVEAAWIGALIEGEGTIGHFSSGRTTNDGRAIRVWTIQVGSTEIETISTLLRLVGGGHVYYVPGRIGNKEAWMWGLKRINEIHSLLPQIMPYLTGKRDRAIELLSKLQEEQEHGNDNSGDGTGEPSAAPDQP